MTDQAQKQAQKTIELCSATIRSFSKKPTLYFRGNQLYDNNTHIPLYASHLQTQTNAKESSISTYRGIADSINLRYAYCDEQLHQSLVPDSPIERFIFELLEQLRVDSLVPKHYSGMRSNLIKHFTEWSLRYHHSGLTETQIGILIYTVAQICWSRLNAIPVVKETEDFIEMTRMGIVSTLGTDLYHMKKVRDDQAAFAVHALSIARHFKDMLIEKEGDEAFDEDEQIENLKQCNFKLLLNVDNDQQQATGISAIGESKAWLENDNNYQVFTTAYDKIHYAEKLVRATLLRELREKLDLRIREQGINVFGLTQKLIKRFARPERDDWHYAQEAGYIDGRRLSQLIASPNERRIFKSQRHQPHTDTVITFLLDCSGSMKAHIDNLVLLLDVFGRACENAGIKTEILGFTTGDWNGGQVLKDWRRKGKPKNPGRLNSLSHVIYKDAGTSWRKARKHIAALMKPDLFREGIDGEAIDWAASRLLARSEKHKVLTVISDGSPMDSATTIANDAYYLDNHLKNIITHYEQHPDINIFGLGVKLDLSVYYRKHASIQFEKKLNNQVFNDVLNLWEPTC